MKGRHKDGKAYDYTTRSCQPGMKTFAGRCINQNATYEGREPYQMRMCACDNDLCNPEPMYPTMAITEPSKPVGGKFRLFHMYHIKFLNYSFI